MSNAVRMRPTWPSGKYEEASPH